MPVWDVSVAVRKFHHLVIAEGSKRMFSLDLTWKENGSIKKEKRKKKTFVQTFISVGGIIFASTFFFALDFKKKATLINACHPGTKSQ